MSRRLLTVVILLVLLWRSTDSLSQVTPAEQDAKRGMTKTVVFESIGPTIRAKSHRAIESPILIRVNILAERENGSKQYQADVVGLVAGDFDLRNFLERQDGSSLNLPPLQLNVATQLPPDRGVDLYTHSTAPSLEPTNYRVKAGVFIAIWLSSPVLYLIYRRMNTEPPVEPAPPPYSPTLADQLRPLVEKALDGSLSIRDRGRLELLMYSHWREKLEMSGPQPDVIHRLRHHPKAGVLLRTIEQWLHGKPAPNDVREHQLAELLSPYRHAPAIEEVNANFARSPV